MSARLTKVDETILSMARSVQREGATQAGNNWAAIEVIRARYGVSLDRAATLLAQAQMSEAALKEIQG